MTQLFSNNFVTTVAQTFGISDTFLYLTSTTGIPAITSGNYLLLTVFRKTGVEEREHEVVKATAIVGNMLTVVRAHEGAAASQFLAGDSVSARVTALSLSSKADLNSPAFTGTVSGITAAMVGAPAGSGSSTGANTGDQDLSGKQNVLVSGTNIKTLNGASLLGAGNVALSLLANYTYDDRAALRGLTPADGDATIVKELGLFIWKSGSTEPDDDETCFATASGRWLLECPHWDAVEAFASTIDDAQSSDVENAETRLTSSETRWPGSILHGSVGCDITSVSPVTQVSFPATIAGAAVGDHVVANPPDALGERIAYYACVTSTDTVTIYLNNPSAGSQTIATGTWKISVIKEV